MSNLLVGLFTMFSVINVSFLLTIQVLQYLCLLRCYLIMQSILALQDFIHSHLFVTFDIFLLNTHVLMFCPLDIQIVINVVFLLPPYCNCDRSEIQFLKVLLWHCLSMLSSISIDITMKI